VSEGGHLHHMASHLRVGDTPPHRVQAGEAGSENDPTDPHPVHMDSAPRVTVADYRPETGGYRP